MKAPNDRRAWQHLTWLVGVVSGTGRLYPHKPQSLLVIGPPGCGKTALLNRYAVDPTETAGRNSHLTFATTATSYGMLHILRERVPRGVTHFVAPELQSLMRRKGALWDAWLGIMLPAMEEGIMDIHDASKRWRFHGERLGLIAACADDAFDNSRAELAGTGFLSRVLLVHFNRSTADVVAARRALTAGDTTELLGVTCDYPARFKIGLSARLANVIDDYAAELTPDDVHRSANRFRALTQVVAFLDQKTEASRVHFDALRRAEYLWRQTR